MVNSVLLSLLAYCVGIPGIGLCKWGVGLEVLGSTPLSQCLGLPVVVAVRLVFRFVREWCTGGKRGLR